MSGRAPREKGMRLERLAVDILQSFGHRAKRVPLSGAAEGFKGDLWLQLLKQELHIECKARGHGFNFLYQQLAGNDAVVVKADRQDPLIAMPLRAFAKLLGELIQVKSVEAGAFEPQSTDSLKPWEKGTQYIGHMLDDDRARFYEALLEQPVKDEMVPRRSSLLSEPPSEKQP